MRISAILLFLCISSLFAENSYSQKARVTIKQRNVALENILHEIENQTDYLFLYNSGQINVNDKVSVNVKNQPVSDVLHELLSDKSIKYLLEGTHIVLQSGVKSETESEIAVPVRQGITITGTVTDETGEFMPGVNVVVKGTNTGVVTNVDGKYTITAPNRETVLVYSFMGYVSQEVVVGERTEISVILQEDTREIEEVVVVGYGVQQKETLTGSITSIQGTEVLSAPVTNVSQSIAGRLPGVFAVTRSGEPGNDGTTIRVRGINTLGDNSALIVVDGVPGRSLDRIDPNIIESISVLKDASAAIYGAQAANGVILITTKRGLTGKPQVTVNMDMGLNQPTVLPTMCNAPEYATALNEVDIYRNRTPRYTDEDIRKYGDGSDPWKYPNTDWFDETFKKWALQMNANVGVSGGSEFMKYFVSVGTKHQDAIYKNSALYYNQHDLATNLDININKYISLGIDLVGRYEDRNTPMVPNSGTGTGEIFAHLMRGKPNTPAYWPNGLPGPDIEFGSNPVVITTNQTGYNKDKRYILNSNFKLNISIPWVEGLSLSGSAALDKTVRFYKRFMKPWYLYSWDGTSYDDTGTPVLVAGKKGVDDPNLTEYMEDNKTLLINGLVRYDKTIAKNHQINFMVGVEARSGHNDNFSAYRRFFESDLIDELNAGGTSQMSNSGTASHHARMNFFGRMNYGYMSKYLAEFIWRVDGSYIFPKEGRYGFFPGVSLGWRISEEDFWKDNIPFVNHLKIRASYGKTGNDRIDAYQYLTTYSFVTTKQYLQVFNIDEDTKGLQETRIPNPEVTWEVANQMDVGFDAQFLNNKIAVTFDYFDYRRSNILWNRNASVPRSTGLTLPRENIGKVTNRGFDFDVSYRDKAGDFSYRVSVNGGYAKNKITFWDEAPGAPEYQQSTGKPMNTALYYQSIGVFKDQAAVDAYPHWSGARPGDLIFKDVNDDGVINGNDRVRSEKTDYPTLQGGLGLDLQYKQWYLTALFQGAAGAEQYIRIQGGEWGNYWKEDFDGRWTSQNTDANKPRIHNREEEYWAALGNRHTYFLHKTDYIRLKNLELGYHLPNDFLGKLGIQACRVYLSGFNLLTYSPDLKDFDPEDSNATWMNYPLSRIINFGLSVTF